MLHKECLYDHSDVIAVRPCRKCGATMRDSLALAQFRNRIEEYKVEASQMRADIAVLVREHQEALGHTHDAEIKVEALESQLLLRERLHLDLAIMFFELTSQLPWPGFRLEGATQRRDAVYQKLRAIEVDAADTQEV